jgi:acyl carrier protein
MPDLTAERFLPDPFRPGEGRTMYRTGDLARYLPDGNVQFIGRRDGQAKIHGFRVETGEVALALEVHPAVRTAVVTVFNDSGGFKSLAAYLVKAEGATASLAEVREHLAGRLPSYMMPVSMTWIDKVPLTPRGKINCRALPEPIISRGLEDKAPATVSEAEAKMIALWEEVLGASDLGPDDDFFDLGGHSLLAIRLIDRVLESSGVRMPVSTMFEAPTVRLLAGHVSKAEKVRAPLVRQPRPERIPLSYAQRRLWFIDQLEGSSSEYNMPQALRLRGQLDLPALRQAVKRLFEPGEAVVDTGEDERPKAGPRHDGF